MFVFSSATGAELSRVNGVGNMLFGHAVDALEDLDGDGKDDYVVGAIGAIAGGIDSGSAFVISSINGDEIFSIAGEGEGHRFGFDVSALGDVDGDGVGDFGVGAPYADPQGLETGAVYLYSGSTGELLRRLEFGAADSRFGWAIGDAGDLDDDGMPEVLAGAWGEDPNGMTNAGGVSVLSLSPFLHLDVTELSASGTGTATFTLDFPVSEAGVQYALLLSAVGPGPSTMLGLEIPLTQDALFQRIVSGNVPAIFQGAFGILGPNGEAQATLDASPTLAPAIGRTLHCAAMTFDLGPPVGRMSSVVRYLAIVP